jgi:hypothetical protein
MSMVWKTILVACIAVILACVVILCSGCATGIVRVKGNGEWSFYGFQFCQEFRLPTLNVSSNGMFDIYNVVSKPDSNAVKDLAEGAVKGLK